MPAPEDVYVTGTLGVLAVGASSHNVEADTLTVSSEGPLAAIAGKLFAENLTVSSSTPSMDAFLLVRPSTLQGGDVAYPRTATYPMHVADRMVAASDLHPRVVRDVADGGMLSDAASFSFGPNLSSSGLFGTVAYPRTVATPTLRPSTMTVASALEGARSFFLESSGTLGASSSGKSVVELVLTDLGTVGATLTAEMARLALLVDSLVVSSTVDAVNTSSPVLAAPPAFVSADVVALGSTAWTSNTDNWAMSRYAPFDLTSVAVWQGSLYATGPSGLVELSGSTDRGANISARLDSHLTDFKDHRLKLPRALYLGYRSEQPLTVTMSATDAGEEVAYDYVAPPRLAETFVPDRVGVGRGLRSRYFRYSILNDAGGYFSIDTAFLDADISDRRV